MRVRSTGSVSSTTPSIATSTQPCPTQVILVSSVIAQWI